MAKRVRARARGGGNRQDQQSADALQTVPSRPRSKIEIEDKILSQGPTLAQINLGVVQNERLMVRGCAGQSTRFKKQSLVIHGVLR
jgi:hypothetical protein